MFFRVKRSESRAYLQIVNNRRDKGKVKQEVVATLGRLDALKETGALDSLLRSGLKFSEQIAVIDAHKQGEAIETDSRRIGLPMIFGRLWKELGIQAVLATLAKERKHQFSIERAIYLTVLHRLSVSGSDRAAEQWCLGYRIEGADGIDLHHLYRAMAWLGEPLADADQHGATGFSPRCTKDVIEEELFRRRRDLFTDLRLVFFDTTSIYFEGEGGEDIGAYGHSKDHRPDLKQMVVGAIIDHHGKPLCCELWPGNTTDVKTLVPIIDRLRLRFGINQACVVADRGMISEKTLADLQERKIDYILGARMRRQMVGERRYIVCVNEDQRKKDAADREAIIASLREKLKQGGKSLVGNKGYRKYVKSAGSAFAIDEEKVQQESRYDGKWVLSTSMPMPAREVALAYKELWMVEQIFRSTKTVLTTRPIYHKCDETIRGHVFCSFLALVLMKELQERLDSRNEEKLEWGQMLRDLEELKQITITSDNKEMILRTELKGDTGKVFQAAGVAIPPKVLIPQKGKDA